MTAALRIIVPAYNEASRIGPTLTDYCSHFGERATIVVVANGCTDETVAVVTRLAETFPNVQVLEIPAKIGKGGAIRVGLMTAVERYVGFTDADRSTSATEFDRLFRALEADGDGVIGSRWARGSSVDPPQPWQRRVASRAFNLIVQGLFGLPFLDTQCGAKLFRTDAVVPLLDGLEVSNFAFDIDVLASLQRAGRRVREIPIAWSDAPGGTKIKLFSASRSMLAAVLRLRLRDSTIARVPYFDYFARRSVIPVRGEFSLLVLSEEHPDAPKVSAGTALVRGLAQSWADAGHLVSWVCAAAPPPLPLPRAWPLVVYPLGGRLARLRTLIWYVFSSPRRYDALFEIAGDRPFFIPSFSVKRSYLIRGGPLRALAEAAYRRWYRHATVVDVRVPQLTAERAATILGDLDHAHPHAATFVRSSDGWTLRYVDGEGTRRERVLR